MAVLYVDMIGSWSHRKSLGYLDIIVFVFKYSTFNRFTTKIDMPITALISFSRCVVVVVSFTAVDSTVRSASVFAKDISV